MSRGRLASRKRSCLGGFLLSNLCVLMAMLRICEARFQMRSTMKHLLNVHSKLLAITLSLSFRHQVEHAQKVNSCTYMFSLTFLTLCFCFHHLPTFSYHSRRWVSRRGHSNGETCGYNRPAGILIQKVQHLICATCSHVSIYVQIQILC